MYVTYIKKDCLKSASCIQFVLAVFKFVAFQISAAFYDVNYSVGCEIGSGEQIFVLYMLVSDRLASLAVHTHRIYIVALSFVLLLKYSLHVTSSAIYGSSKDSFSFVVNKTAEQL